MICNIGYYNNIGLSTAIETCRRLPFAEVRQPGPDLLSAGPCSEKNVGPFNSNGRPYFSCKKWRPFLVFAVCQLSLHFSSKTGEPFFAHHSPFYSGVAHFSGMQKITAPFVGPLFVGPCLAEHAEHA